MDEKALLMELQHLRARSITAADTAAFSLRRTSVMLMATAPFALAGNLAWSLAWIAATVAAAGWTASRLSRLEACFGMRIGKAFWVKTAGAAGAGLLAALLAHVPTAAPFSALGGYYFAIAQINRSRQLGLLAGSTVVAGAIGHFTHSRTVVVVLSVAVAAVFLRLAHTVLDAARR